MKYDYLVVGAGLYGAVFAYEAKKKGKTCLVIDKRDHIAGNIYCENVSGINVHKYGAHIFHTSDKKIWEYVNQFAEFNNYINSPVARYKNELYNLPFNMNTFSKMWNIATPQEAKDIIASQIADLNITEPKNLEEQALSLVGKDVYEKLIKGYTEKQWGRDCKDLPSFIIKRLPLRFIYDNNYFNDRYQGIPIGGYTKIVEKMLDGIEVRLNTNYLDNREEFDAMADKIVYTGMIDQFYDYKLGVLEYRSVRFETEELPMENYQEMPLSTTQKEKCRIQELLSISTLNSASSRQPLFQESTQANGRRATSRTIRSIMIRTMHCISSTRSLPTRNTRSSSADVLADTSTTIWIR